MSKKTVHRKDAEDTEKIKVKSSLYRKVTLRHRDKLFVFYANKAVEIDKKDWERIKKFRSDLIEED